MIRSCSSKDKTSLATYLSTKLNMPLSDAVKKANKIIKSGLTNFIKEGKDLEGVCYVESKLVNDKKEKFIVILVNNWRLAESFIQCLRWELNGDYFLSVPKHDFLNRTYNKNGIRFLRVDGDNNLYISRFEKRFFQSYKAEDNED